MANKLAVIINGKEYVSKEALKAQKALSGLGNTTVSINKMLKTAFVGVAATVVGATTALIAASISAANTADSIDEQSQKIGLSTKAYQEWGYVMSLNGMSVDSLQMSTKTLSNAVVDALAGNKKYIATFQDLNISLLDTNGNIKTQEQLLNETIFALSDIDDETTRTALATDLLGKSATELAPIFNAGKDAIQGMIKEANDLNLIIGDEAIAAGSRLADSIERIKSTWKTFSTELMTPFMESLATIADSILPTLSTVLGRFATSVKAFVESPTFDDMNENVSVMISNAIVFMEHFPTIMKSAISDIKTSWDDLFSGAKFNRTITRFGDQLVELIKSFTSAIGLAISGMFSFLAMPLQNVIATVINAITGGLTYLVNSVISLVNSVINPIIDLINLVKKEDIKKSPIPELGQAYQIPTYNLQAETSAFNQKWIAATDRLFLAMSGGEETTEEQVLMLGTTNSAISALKDALAENEATTRALVKSTEKETSPGAWNLSDYESAKKRRKETDEDSGLQSLFDTIGKAFSSFSGSLISSIGALSSVQSILNPFATILEGMMEVLGPVIDSILSPLVGILKIFGNLIGSVLAPVLQWLTPIIELVGNIFVWLYNKVLMPIGNALIYMFNGVYNTIALVINGIIYAVNFLLGWLGVNIGTVAYKEQTSGFISEIDSGTLTESGTTYTGSGSSSSTSVESVTINVYQTFEGNVIGEGGLEAVGAFVVKAIQAYSGVGGNVTIVGAI